MVFDTYQRMRAKGAYCDGTSLKTYWLLEGMGSMLLHPDDKCNAQIDDQE